VWGDLTNASTISGPESRRWTRDPRRSRTPVPRRFAPGADDHGADPVVLVHDRSTLRQREVQSTDRPNRPSGTHAVVHQRPQVDLSHGAFDTDATQRVGISASCSQAQPVSVSPPVCLGNAVEMLKMLSRMCFCIQSLISRGGASARQGICLQRDVRRKQIVSYTNTSAMSQVRTGGARTSGVG
jgi:hypothetical protein